MHLVAFEYQRGYFMASSPTSASPSSCTAVAAGLRAGFIRQDLPRARRAHREENGPWYYDSTTEARQSDEERIMKAVDGILVASGKKSRRSMGAGMEGSGLPTEEQGKALQEARLAPQSDRQV